MTYNATCKRFDQMQDHYCCSNYKSNTGSYTAHFIREETLKRLVLSRIFDVTALFYDNAVSFLELVRNQRFNEQEKAMKKQRGEVEQAKKRIDVHAPDKNSGKRVQKVDMVWNFINIVDFPNEPLTKTTTKEKTA